MNINDILAYAGDREIDFMDIDAENFDYLILKAIDFKKYRPKLIWVEIHATPTLEQLMKHEIYQLLVTNGYHFAARARYTVAFKRNDLLI